jgi:hypothetical protein
MKKNKKNKNLWLKESDIAIGDLYFTTANQYRAVLAMKGDFLIYAPSSEGMGSLNSDSTMPFDNSPWKKCQIATFAQKEYKAFEWQGITAIKHQLNNMQLAEAFVQCNAIAAVDALLAE